uniref:DDE Tnp4 domain-containing protein n=1 Tax=Sinocyclocheilus anshuiensis TaxID=1608454 RepID=A0A671NI47_9TELE
AINVGLQRRLWLHDIIRGRNQYGAYNNLVQELQLDDARFAAYFRLNKSQFEDLLQIIERLCICLRYLATGDSFRSIAFSFRVDASTVAGIVSQVCEAIWNCLLSDCMPVPDVAVWREITAEFQHLLAFPSCLGAMDVKHVVIEAPPSSGSLYYNYKGTFSIVLAVVDARYRFRVVDIGAYGRNSDGGTLAASAFGSALRQKRKGFNFHLSHARRMVECTFGILAAQWRVYRRVLGVSPEVAEKIVKATCMLHNFLRRDVLTAPAPTLTTELSLGMQNATMPAERDRFAEYFMSPAGRVPWQYRN